MTVLTNKIVKTKKPHRCFACGRLFPSGSMMIYQTNVSYGDFSAIYTCDTCQKLIVKASRDLFDDTDQIYPEFCVCNALGDIEYKTPEEWLQAIS